MKLEIKKISKKNQTKVWLLNKKYIIKKASSKIIKAEKTFFDNYKEKRIFEKVIRCNTNCIIYKYEYGNNKYISRHVYKRYLNQIRNIVNKYKEVNNRGYGEIYSLKNTWKEFLVSEVSSREKTMHDNQKTSKVMEAIDIISTYSFKKELIHGDFGIYNMIYNNRKIKLIIDPNPILGDKLYDIIYFIFSKVEFFYFTDIKELSVKFQEPQIKIINMMYIVLYIRITIEMKHNNKDKVKQYNEIWSKLAIKEKEMETTSLRR